MTDIGHQHLHHLAKRLHHTNSHLARIQGNIADIAGRALGTIEVGAGAWLGGLMEGYTDGKTLAKVPLNLLTGLALIGASHAPRIVPNHLRDHLNSLGSGFVSSYVAAVGYAFGSKWKKEGFKFWGRHTLSQPYNTSSSGDLSDAQMANIVERMRQAAGAAHP